MKTELVKVRLTVQEKAAFQRAADISGIPLSAWVRERLRSAAIREMEGAGELVPFIQRVSLVTDNG